VFDKLRLWWALWKLRKEIRTMDKSLLLSVTVWGAIIMTVGNLGAVVGAALHQGQPIPWGAVVAAIGELLAIIGGRRVAGKILSK